MANGATLVSATSANKCHHPGGPTGAVSLGSIVASVSEILSSPPPALMVKPASNNTPIVMIMPKITSIMVIDLYPPMVMYMAVNTPMKATACQYCNPSKEEVNK